MSKDERASLAALAGGESNVVKYCAALLAHPPSATAGPPAGATPAIASPIPTEAHGFSRPPRTPDPHPTNR